MKSIYASRRTCQEIWPDFIAHFRSETTAASYQADLDEIMNELQMDFQEIGEGEAQEYFEHMMHKVEQGIIVPGTMAKKFRELHSFAAYICENRTKYEVEARYQDWFYPYLKLVARQEKFAKTVPAADMDRLLEAAQEDGMAYCILVLLYRAGMTSTEIIELKSEQLTVYADGVYAELAGRRNPCFIPEDAFEILKAYMEKRRENEYLFYNQRGGKLNLMYISRMLRKYEEKADVPFYSAQTIRSTCGVTMAAYGVNGRQIAGQLGITGIQIRRYQNLAYQNQLLREANNMVKLTVKPPSSI